MLKINLDILHEAIARNLTMVLSLPAGGSLHHHKTRFLSEGDDGFWVETVPGEQSLIDQLVQTGQPAGISFKTNSTRVVFTATLSQRQPSFQINSQTIVDAIKLQFPQEIKEVQRRNDYRVHIQPGSDAQIRIWRMNVTASLHDKPVLAQELNVVLKDISMGGVGVIFKPKDGKPPLVSMEDRLRIELNYGGNVLLLEGQMRSYGPINEPGMLRSGVQFKVNPNDLEARQAMARLTRIVGELQRREVRHYRMGIN